MRAIISILAILMVHTAPAGAQTVKIACIGNSITYGAGIENRDKLSYPAQLQAWLGDSYEVRNYGVSGATMLRKGDFPYWTRPEFKAALEWKPDIVIIKLGTNDSKPQNWQYASEFESDYSDMIAEFAAITPKPRILVALPVPVFTEEKWGIRDKIVRDEVIPKIKTVASKKKCQVIDLYTPLLPYKYAFPDDVHPNSIGASVMVEEIYRNLFQRDRQHSSGYLNTAALPAPGAECRGEEAGWGAGKDWFTQFDDINKIGQTRQVDLVFLGNSITQGFGGDGRTVWTAAPGLWDSLYKPRNAANFGISGDRTQHVIWRIENGNFDHIKPKAVVLEIGVNNFPVHNAEEIAEGIRGIIKSLQKKAPAAKILLLGPLPAGLDKSDPNRQKYQQVHQIIRSFGNGKTIFYLNLDKTFIKPDGTLADGLMAQDAIHLTADGYKAWVSAMEPDLKKILGK